MLAIWKKLKHEIQYYRQKHMQTKVFVDYIKIHNIDFIMYFKEYVAMLKI